MKRDADDMPPLMPDGDPELSRLRVPPHSLEAEQSVLGGLLLDNGAWDRAGDLLMPEDFYRREHRVIFEAIGRLVMANKPADVLTVYESLRGREQECGGLLYLNELAGSVPSAFNIRRYSEIVAERAVTRRVIAQADEIATLAFNPATTFDELCEKASVALSAIQRRQIRKGARPIDELLAKALDRYSDLAEGRGEKGIPTGIDRLDAILHGLKRGKLIGLAARPSVGKSTAARKVALTAAMSGRTVLIFSMEMPAEEVTDCLIAEAGRIDSERLQTGQLTDDDWGRLVEAVESLRGANLHIDDQGGLTLADIRAKARAVKNLDLLVLDYLQLSVSTLKNATTNDQVAEISKGLKALAMELGIPILVLSQLSRKVEDRFDREPQLSDLRDSGAIEQDLDIAILLWTVKENDDGSDRLVGWKVAKHRGGRKGRFGMRFHPATYQWFESDEPLKAEVAKAKRGGVDE